MHVRNVPIKLVKANIVTAIIGVAVAISLFVGGFAVHSPSYFSPIPGSVVVLVSVATLVIQGLLLRFQPDV